MQLQASHGAYFLSWGWLRSKENFLPQAAHDMVTNIAQTIHKYYRLQWPPVFISATWMSSPICGFHRIRVSDWPGLIATWEDTSYPLAEDDLLKKTYASLTSGFLRNDGISRFLAVCERNTFCLFSLAILVN
ncbi:MAG: hypothetical protein ACYC6S_01935 [Desulfobulbia bacterium]